MGFFDFWNKPEPQKKLTQPFKRAYAAANVSRLFNDFNPTNQSADSELVDSLDKLRARSRDLARNNEYVKRYLSLLKNNIVGERGFTLQVKAKGDSQMLDMLGNQAVEDAFKAWGKLGNCTVDGRMNWNDAQKLAIESMARDGEIFIIKHRSGKFKDSFSIEFIEADQVDQDLNDTTTTGNKIRMGIELDKFQKPVAYYIKAAKPGEFDYSAGSTKHTRIDASRVIHLYMPLRAGQTRGEPWMAPAISAIKQLGALREAAVINARVGASKMGFFTSPAGDGFLADDMDGQVPIMDAEPGTFHQLPAGTELTTFDTQYPASEFEAFNKAVLKGIASGLNVSYTSISNDLEATSYSSIRQGALEERDAYKNIQNFVAEHFVRPIYESWLASAMEVGSLTLPLTTFDKFANASEFRGRAWSWVDPQKEMTAAVMGMKNGILSLQDVAGQYGKDTEELLGQIQKDKELAEQFGITYALEPYGAAFMPILPENYGAGAPEDEPE